MAETPIVHWTNFTLYHNPKLELGPEDDIPLDQLVQKCTAKTMALTIEAFGKSFPDTVCVDCPACKASIGVYAQEVMLIMNNLYDVIVLDKELKDLPEDEAMSNRVMLIRHKHGSRFHFLEAVRAVWRGRYFFLWSSDIAKTGINPNLRMPSHTIWGILETAILIGAEYMARRKAQEDLIMNPGTVSPGITNETSLYDFCIASEIEKADGGAPIINRTLH